MAYTHTKEIFTPLLKRLDTQFSFDQPVHITLTGCGNGCAHRSVADIGIEGLTAKTKDGQRAEAFKIAVGGSLLAGGHFNEVLKGKLFTSQLYGALAALLADYQTQQLANETYYAYFQRLGIDHFQTILDQYLAQAA
ncbi:ferredoxin--nitrite reductase [Loigolactobacillus coryniformis]|uniref:ferredoxin--nitrite reductase n=1 Tax=Loigolactobacillus coryniformis TaxID=1610 RepID=UPI0002194A1C|nr:ferredoxin--nitrite reductase [Loigolactobacillus coryniformis]